MPENSHLAPWATVPSTPSEEGNRLNNIYFFPQANPKQTNSNGQNAVQFEKSGPTSSSIQLKPRENACTRSQPVQPRMQRWMSKVALTRNVQSHSNKEGLITNFVTWQHRRLCHQSHLICPGAKVPWCQFFERHRFVCSNWYLIHTGSPRSLFLEV